MTSAIFWQNSISICPAAFCIPRPNLPAQFSSVTQCIWLYVTPWITACQASLSITSSQILLKLMSIKLVMPSNQLILWGPLLQSPQSCPASRAFPKSQLFAWGSQSIGDSALASFLPMNTQDWAPLGWTGWISLQSKGLSRVFCKPINSSS